MQRWFAGGPSVDAEIKTQFTPLTSLAAASQLPGWTSTPRSSLALVILLDQFPRNNYRNSSQSYTTDDLALNTTLDAIAKGYDKQLPLLQNSFFYFPLMHDESLVGQIAGMALLEGLKMRCVAEGEEDTAEYIARSCDYSWRHLEAVKRFGRFPSRNQVLGRESTAEEIEFLKEYPSGF